MDFLRLIGSYCCVAAHESVGLLCFVGITCAFVTYKGFQFGTVLARHCSG